MINTSAFIKTLGGKPIAVFGLGVSGLPAARALAAAGASVMAWDDDEEKRLAAAREGIQLSNFADSDLKEYASLVLAPGIPLLFPAPHPMAQKAIEAAIPIIGDLEILHLSDHGHRTVGITGTNGKSTTTALITHILNAGGIDAQAGGNIGQAALDLKLPKKDGVFILEISSYQMDLCHAYTPDIAVLLNVTPDHLDRHGGMEGYTAAKERILNGDGIAVIAIDDAPTLAAFDKTVKAGVRKAVPVSVKKECAGGVFIKDNHLFDALTDSAVDMGGVADIPALPGSHNLQNLCAAYAVCRNLGMGGDDILRHAKTYPGLPHRQFMTRVINGIAYVNDSKATNAEAAVKAIACYNNIYLIAGGQPKEGGLNGLEIYIDKLRHVFLIGQAVDDFAKWCDNVGVPYTKSFSLDIAVLEAHKNAQAGRGQPGGAGTVLLSPACASWDQFRNFEHRGDVFTELVNNLSDEVGA